MEKLYRRPALIIAVIGLVTVFFAVQLPRAELDNNNFRFISPGDPARTVMKYIDDSFGSSLFILVGLKRTYGDVFDGPFLKRIRNYVERVEQIDIIDPVTSIVNADYITGSADSIIVEKLLPGDFSGAKEEIAALREKILSWDMYRRSLVSDDFSATQILVPLNIAEEDAGKSEIIDSFMRVRDIAHEMFDDHAEVYVTGIPVISATINEAMRADLKLLVPLVLIAVLLTLFFSFRRLGSVILPLLTVLVAAVWSVGAMPLFGVKLSVISSVLPVILVAVGSAYGIHVVTHYQEETAGRKLGREEHIRLITAVIKKILKPVFLAALTTFVGFSSFCFTTVLPIREFGFFASFGVLASFAVSITLIPALLAVRGQGGTAGKKKQSSDHLSEGIVRFFTAAALRKGLVFFFGALLIAAALFGASRLVIDNVFIEYFKDDTGISKSDRFIREIFGGSKLVSVVAESSSSELLLSPESLSAMDALSAYLENRVPEAGKTLGFTDLIKRVNQVFNVGESPEGLRPSSAPLSDGTEFGFGFDEPVSGFGEADASAVFVPDGEPGQDENPLTVSRMTELLSRASRSGKNGETGAVELVTELKKLINYEGASYFEIPSDPAKYGKTHSWELSRLVSNYLILLSSDIASYANDPLEPTAIKTNVQLKTLGESDTARAVSEIRRFVEANFPETVKVIIGGSAMVEASLNRQVVRSQLISLVISLVLVFLIIAVSNKSLAGGLVGIVPLSLSILVNFGVMGFLGIKLNIGTSMIASLAVGIGIDYTIHYMEAFKRELSESGIGSFRDAQGLREFLGKSFAVSGKAIIINAVSVGAGFAVLVFSRFNMLGDFGLLIALTMIISALVSLTIIPALLLALQPAFVRR